jgi:hypothetical protein
VTRSNGQTRDAGILGTGYFSKRTGSNTTVSTTTEKEYFYPPEEFAKLNEHEAIYYFKNTREDGFLNLK